MIASDKNLVADFRNNAERSDNYRVMIVDDSSLVRRLIRRIIESEKDFKIVATAANGQLAIDNLRREPADVILLDVEMPVIDGLAAIPQLKAIDPGVQIVMVSSLTQKNAETSLHALELGAADYIPKPTIDQATAMLAKDFSRELVEKVRALGFAARKKNVRLPVGLTPYAPPPAAEAKKIALRAVPLPKPDIIAIGASTGGPQALFEIIRALGNGLPQPVLLTQHMPPSFTTILADHIARQCGVNCREAQDGELLRAGHYYVAPGDSHLLITEKSERPIVKLTRDPPENFCRPAIDPMLRSLVDIYGKNILAVILTGMGQDGMKGCKRVVEAGGGVIAQDEATSIVWGMPAAVANAGLCSSVLPLQEIGPTIRRLATRQRVSRAEI